MTDKEKDILHRLFDLSMIDLLAEQRICEECYVCATLIDSLTENQQLHSELGLVHRPRISYRAVKEALARNGVPTFRTSCCPSMPNVRLLREDSLVTIEKDPKSNSAVLRSFFRPIRLSLSGNSVAKLMLFFDAVLPEAIRMVEERTKELQKRNMLIELAKATIRALLDANGRKYCFIDYIESIGLEILLPTNRVLHIEFTADDAAEQAVRLEETLRAVDAGHGPDRGYVRRLSKIDEWAY